MKTSKFAAGLLFVIIVLMASCSRASSTTPSAMPARTESQPASSMGKTIAVSIQGFKFNPADVNIKAGDTVVWTNQDSVPHTVESSDGELKSDELSNEDTYKHTFAKAGIHNYICGIHQSMHGSVTVQ